jgi:hypothetical protein
VCIEPGTLQTDANAGLSGRAGPVLLVLMMWRRLAVAAMLACSLSLLVVSLMPVGGSHPVMAGLALAVVFAAVMSRRATHLVPAVSALSVSPSLSALRRRRGAFLRQSNPDVAGRARPRAPGLLLS